jgi:hypothetical protein
MLQTPILNKIKSIRILETKKKEEKKTSLTGVNLRLASDDKLFKSTDRLSITRLI